MPTERDLGAWSDPEGSEALDELDAGDLEEDRTDRKH
jgi:hypothetical protein